MEMRLQKFLASCGIDSRRKCEEIIAAGRVVVNGVRITEQGVKVDPDKDKIEFDKKVISIPKKTYIALNKPMGYIVSKFDPHNPQTIYDLIPEELHHLFPVGRIDKDSEGLMILTNDGEFSNSLMHPTFHIEKEYIVVVRGYIKEEELEGLRKGVNVFGKKTMPAEITVVAKQDNKTTLNVVIKEGRKRQIRMMFDIIDHKVLYLQRIRIGKLTLGNLKKGRFRYLKKDDIENII